MRNNSPYFRLYQNQFHVAFKWWGFFKRKIRRQIVLVAYEESSFCAQPPRMVPTQWVHEHFVCVLPTRNYALKTTNKNLKFSFNLVLNSLQKHHSTIRENTENKYSPSPDLCSGGYFFIFPFSLALVIHLNTTDRVSAAGLSALCLLHNCTKWDTVP